MADIELEDLGGAEAETVPTVVIANPSLKTTDLGTSQVGIYQLRIGRKTTVDHL